MCVCVSVWGRKGWCVCVCECVWEERVVCVCVSMCGREGWCVYMYYYYVMLLHVYKNNIRPTTHNIHTAMRSYKLVYST